MFFNNLDFAPMHKYLSYQNMDEMRALFNKLLHGTVIWQTKNINIFSIITDVALKNISYII